jgi:hypothetical protein
VSHSSNNADGGAIATTLSITDVPKFDDTVLGIVVLSQIPLDSIILYFFELSLLRLMSETETAR